MLCKRNSQFHLYNRFINLLSVSRDCSVIIVLSLSRNLSHFSPIWNNRSSSRNLKNRGNSSTAYRSAKNWSQVFFGIGPKSSSRPVASLLQDRSQVFFGTSPKSSLGLVPNLLGYRSQVFFTLKMCSF